MSVSLDTEKCCGIFLGSDRENLLSNIFVSMSRQCQKLQLLIDHMAVSLKNKFACATVCICECVCVLAGFLWQLQAAAAAAAACAAIIIMKCAAAAR